MSVYAEQLFIFLYHQFGVSYQMLDCKEKGTSSLERKLLPSIEELHSAPITRAIDALLCDGVTNSNPASIMGGIGRASAGASLIATRKARGALSCPAVAPHVMSNWGRRICMLNSYFRARWCRLRLLMQFNGNLS